MAEDKRLYYLRWSRIFAMIAALLLVAGVALLAGPVICQDTMQTRSDHEYQQLAQETKSDPPVLPQAEPTTDSETHSMTTKAVEQIVQPTEQTDITTTKRPAQQSSSVKAETPKAIVSPGNTGADLAACKAKNKDFAAWLTIPGTRIDYPVVQSNNTDYYLAHTFTGSKSSLGTLFSLESVDYASGRNIAIYGHHITGSGQKMFKPLLSYKSKDFWAEHSTIYLDSTHGYRTYKVFAVINLTSDRWDPATASFSDDAAFSAFLNRAKQQSLYDTGVAVSAADRILTLITCDRSYAGKAGRLIVMAVEQ